jgi:hypothetical protein
VPNQGSKVGGGLLLFYVSLETAGAGRKCEWWRCHGEAARSVLADVRGDVFARDHAVAANHRSRTWKSQFGLSAHPVTRYNTLIHNIISTAPQLSISKKAQGTLPEDGYVMLKHVGATIHN